VLSSYKAAECCRVRSKDVEMCACRWLHTVGWVGGDNKEEDEEEERFGLVEIMYVRQMVGDDLQLACARRCPIPYLSHAIAECRVQ
jgi:hypothetical protein